MGFRELWSIVSGSMTKTDNCLRVKRRKMLGSVMSVYMKEWLYQECCTEQRRGVLELPREGK